MRLIAILALVSAAYAASPQDAYFAARDKAIAEVKTLVAKGQDAKAEAVQKTAFADLAKRLLAIVGPTSTKGFAREATINLTTLADEPGFGMLDGLSYAVKDQEGSRLVATTKPLLAAWLKGHAGESDASLRVPEDIEAALRSDNFYTFAIGGDAALSRAAEIEVTKPPGADLAVAALGRWSQDIGPSPLDRLTAAVVKGDHVYIADIEPAAKTQEFPSCQAIWDAADAKAEESDKAHGKQEDAAAGGDERAKIQEKGSDDWLACAGRAVKTVPSYSQLRQEAQDLVDRMAGP
jgi:hypothetical protein